MANKVSDNKKTTNAVVPILLEPKKTLAARKCIRLGTILWAKLNGWPWWPGKFFFFYVIQLLSLCH